MTPTGQLPIQQIVNSFGCQTYQEAGIQPRTQLINCSLFKNRKMSKICSAPNGDRCPGAKAAKRPRRFWEGAGRVGYSWKRRVQQDRCPPWACSRGGPIAAGQVAWGRGLRHSTGRTRAETVPSPELAPGGVRGRKLGSPLAPVPRDPHPGHPARPSPTSPLSGTHGSAELRAGALSWRPENTRSPCPSPATLGPGHGGWPRSQGVGVSGPPSGRGERAGRGWGGGGVGESERLRPRSLSHLLKYPGSDWVSFACSDGVSVDAFNRLWPQLSTFLPSLSSNPDAFELGLGNLGGSEESYSRSCSPITFAQSSYFI